MTEQSCEFKECDKRPYAKFMCKAHYEQARKGQELRPLRGSMSVESRFWPKVNRSDGCWEWNGVRNPFGYGMFYANGRGWGAHRISWELSNGGIPDGAQIDHMCWNRSCVNPEHLRAVSPDENCQNRSGASSRSKSGIRGVWWGEKDKRWNAVAVLKGKRNYLGGYLTAAEAEQVVVAWRRDHMPHSIKDQHPLGH